MNKNYLLGFFCTILYIVVASIQSVLLNQWLFGINVFILVASSFSIVCFLFFLLSLFKHRKIYCKLLDQWKPLLFLNVVSLFNWILYFLAVKYIEPAVAIVLTQGLGPLSLSVYRYLAKIPLNKVIIGSNIVIFTMTFVMCSYVLFYRDIYSNYSRIEMMLGILFGILCSISITATIIISKKLHLNKMPTTVVLSLRFPLLIGICYILYLLTDGTIEMNADIIYKIIFIAIVGISFSLFALQKGIELAPTLIVSMSLAMSPMVVFIFQLYIHTTPFSLLLFLVIGSIVIASAISILYEAKKNVPIA